MIVYVALHSSFEPPSVVIFIYSPAVIVLFESIVAVYLSPALEPEFAISKSDPTIFVDEALSIYTVISALPPVIELFIIEYIFIILPVYGAIIYTLCAVLISSIEIFNIYSLGVQDNIPPPSVLRSWLDNPSLGGNDQVTLLVITSQPLNAT